MVKQLHHHLLPLLCTAALLPLIYISWNNRFHSKCLQFSSRPWGTEGSTAPSNTTSTAPSNTTSTAPSNTTSTAPSNTTSTAPPSSTSTAPPSSTSTVPPSSASTALPAPASTAPSNTTSTAPSNTTSTAPSNTTSTPLPATDPPGLTPIPVLHLRDFAKMPQWDFEDQYRTDRQSHKTTQKCDNSLWTRIQEEPELKHKFIPNIRMLVHNGSISMSDWNRLSHFNNPFGFMNYTHPDVMSALNLLQKPKEPLLPPKPGRDCISCAVVANGGVLWRSKKGAEIDQHDYVFRVNGALVKGFEEDVGSRTDVYVHTAHSITGAESLFRKYNYTRAPHDQGIKYVLIPEGMRDFQWLTGLYKRQRLTAGYFKNRRPWTQYSGQFNETRFYVLHMDFLRYVRNRFLKSSTLQNKFWAISRPTNGAFMMFVALHLCDQVNAYGFITDDHKHYSNYYFERGAKTRVIFFINHDYNMEKVLWRRLHNLSIINLYLGEPREPEPTQGPPKETQGPPKETQGPPKETRGPPKDAKGAPKAAKGAPKAAKGAPKAAKGRPEGGKGAPEGSKGAPKGSKGAPKGGKGAPKGSTGAPEGNTGAPRRTHMEQQNQPMAKKPRHAKRKKV